jgi:hypothetical protein
MYGTIDLGHKYDEYLVLLAKSGMTFSHVGADVAGLAYQPMDCAR